MVYGVCETLKDLLTLCRKIHQNIKIVYVKFLQKISDTIQDKTKLTDNGLKIIINSPKKLKTYRVVPLHYYNIKRVYG